MIDRDEFDQWRDNPITRWVMEAFEVAAEDARDTFLSRFFYGSERDPYEQAYLRGVFSGLMHMSERELNYENVVNMHESGELEHDLSGAWVAKAGRSPQ